MNYTKKSFKNIGILSILSMVLLACSTNVFASDNITSIESINSIDNIDFIIGNIDFDLEDTTDGVISEKDWETLSMKQIDEKMIQAGKKAIGDKQDPLYNFTQDQIRQLTDEEWDAIDKKYEELYGNYQLMDDEYFPEYKEEIIKEVMFEYNIIKDELSSDVRNKIDQSIKKLTSIDNEDDLFSLLDEMYELVEDKVEDYWESEYEDDFSEEKDFMINEIKDVYQDIKKDLSTEIQNKIENAIKELLTIDNDEDFFNLTDEMYQMAEKQLDNYYNSLYGEEL